jgi:hypothetical protein
MHDDPTQLFPETHWKRFATERVSIPSRDIGRVLPTVPIHVELVAPPISARDARKLTNLRQRPLLS